MHTQEIAMEWKTVVVYVLIISLGFLLIPIRISPVTNANDTVQLFESFILRHNKTYRHDPLEYDKRFQIFQKSLSNIEIMNGQRKLPESAYYGLTIYSDLTEEEFLMQTLYPYAQHNKHHGFRQHKVQETRLGGKGNMIRYERAIGIPLKVNWQTKGVITPVRSQGNCGACWAYSTVACIESMVAIKNATLRSFSVQQMIDCAGNNNYGCNGGDICSLLVWLVDNKVPILIESSYPITGTSDTCKLDKTKTSSVYVTDFTCDSFVDMEDDLLKLVANHGPVAAAVNALTWQNYLGGIIQYHCDGAFSMLNHAVQIVGYDISGPIPFYIVRNSWGHFFGNDGYLYIAVGGNICGIANQVSALDVTV